MPYKNNSRLESQQTATRDGVIHCTDQVRGKTVESIYVSGVDNFNVVNIAFTDRTALTVHLIPAVELKVEYNDWSVRDGQLLKAWPPMITR